MASGYQRALDQLRKENPKAKIGNPKVGSKWHKEAVALSQKVEAPNKPLAEAIKPEPTRLQSKDIQSKDLASKEASSNDLTNKGYHKTKTIDTKKVTRDGKTYTVHTIDTKFVKVNKPKK